MPFDHVCQRCGTAYTKKGRAPSTYCSRYCRNLSVRPPGVPATTRFWKFVTMGEHSFEECWEWSGNRTVDGYGVIKDGTRNRRAHRVSWEIHKGPIPDGMHVLHSCDNRPCVNPSHLRLGTHQDNMRDMAVRGRAGGGDGYRFHAKGIQRGENNAHAIATEEVVRWVRAQHAAGVSYKELAARTGLAYPTVYAIANRRTWKHVA